MNRRAASLVGVALVLAMGAPVWGGCESPEVLLRVRVRSDLRPGLQLERVEVLLPDLPEVEPAHMDWVLPDPDSPLAREGVVMLEASGLASDPARRVIVRAYDMGASAVLERELLVDNRGSLDISVFLTANCRGVSCGSGFCLDASCVESTCLDGSQPSCPADLSCAADGDCVEGGECSVGRCEQGICLYEADDALCDGGLVCDPSEGCRASTLAAVDLDGDGIPDLYDEDDDGDGLSDLEECFGGLTVSTLLEGSFEGPMVPDGETLTFVDSSVDGWGSTEGQIEVWGTGYMGIPSPVGAQHVQMCVTEASGLFWQEVFSVPGSTLRWALYRRSLATMETLEVGLGPREATTVEVLGRASEWTFFTGTYRVPEGQTRTRLELRYSSDLAGTGNLLDGVVLEPICERDSDGDGRVDSRDAD